MGLSGSVGGELAFPVSEYRARAERVRAEMASRGVDVLYAMRPENVCYLTGYAPIWHPTRAPLGVALSVREPALLLFDWVRHEDFVRRHALADALVLLPYADVRPVAAALAARGWTEGTVGIEWHSPVPDGPVIGELAAALAERGATIAAGDWIVDHVRVVKSPAEIERVRRAASIADEAFTALAGFVAAGVSERELAARLDLLMAEHGGEDAACPPMVCTGALAWCRNHAFPSRRRLEPGDTVYVDACGVVDRYHANLCRTFALGASRPRAREALEAAEASVRALRSAARQGEPLELALRAAEQEVHARLPRERIWWVGGYSLGIAQPPSWVGHAYLSNDAHGPALAWQPGMVFNFENVFAHRDEGSLAASIDTVLMTDSGLELLSRLPRELAVLPA